MSTPTPPAAPLRVDPPPHPERSVAAPIPLLLDLLDRPPDQRRREYQYRFAQAVVFGLPVLALQRFGHSLGGQEAGRWVAILQGLLAGWVVYIGAAGMLFESMVWLFRRRFTADLLPAAAAVLLYLLTLVRIATARPPWFHWAVVVIVAWTGVRWWGLARPGACARLRRISRPGDRSE